MWKTGARIGAILGHKRGIIEFLGYGTYEGHGPVGDQAVGFLAEMCRSEGMVNPTLRLDSGAVVYGCECWWGTEARVRAMLENPNFTVHEVDIDEVRQRYRDEQAAKSS